MNGTIMAQSIDNKIYDEKSQTDILIGICTREGLMNCEFASSMTEEYSNYIPDAGIIATINQKMEGLSCVLVLGTWCGDSKEQVPRFFKIVDMLEHSFEKFTMYCVDRQKMANGVDIKELHIEKVPTFIFYKNSKEIGRIIETPKKSLEKDMLEIMNSAN